jgi:hypothetical protein
MIKVCRASLVLAVAIASGASALTWSARAEAAEPAAAPTSDARAEAESLKKVGNEAMLQLDLAGALAAYEKALTLTPDDAALYYNVGRVHQAREDFPAALDAFEAFARRASPELKERVPQLDEILKETKAKVGVISLSCRVEDASVRVQVGEKVSITGCGPQPKAVRVSVARAGATFEVHAVGERFQPESVRAAPVGGGAPFPVKLALLLKAVSGTLHVDTVPSGATVAVDGEARGNPPLDLSLAAGDHVVTAQRDGYDTASVPVVVEAGKTRDLRIELQQKQPLTSRWWFWAGVGVLVVGAVTTVSILVIQPERDPEAGSIPPGTIPAPLLRF